MISKIFPQSWYSKIAWLSIAISYPIFLTSLGQAKTPSTPKANENTLDLTQELQALTKQLQKPIPFQDQADYEKFKHQVRLIQKKVNQTNHTALASALEPLLNTINTQDFAQMIFKFISHEADALDTYVILPNLHIACITSPTLTRHLLSFESTDVNALNHDGQSALHCATRACYPQIVRQLLAHPKIQINIIDKYGYTALDYAVRYAHDPQIKDKQAIQETQHLIQLKGGVCHKYART